MFVAERVHPLFWIYFTIFTVNMHNCQYPCLLVATGIDSCIINIVYVTHATNILLLHALIKQHAFLYSAVPYLPALRDIPGYPLLPSLIWRNGDVLVTSRLLRCGHVPVPAFRNALTVTYGENTRYSLENAKLFMPSHCILMY